MKTAFLLGIRTNSIMPPLFVCPNDHHESPRLFVSDILHPIHYHLHSMDFDFHLLYDRLPKTK